MAMDRRSSMTQRAKVLRLLNTQPDGVCSTTFLASYIPRAAARINELRNDGYEIVTEPCRYRWHDHDTRQVQYRLVGPRQGLIG